MRLTDDMRSEYLEGGSTYNRLSTVGMEFNSDGTIELDATKLKAAILDNPTSVRKLFVGATGDAGGFGALKQQVEDYTKRGGLVQGRQRPAQGSDRQDRLAARHDGDATRTAA
jgi:flagellar capping protein FliD